MQALRTKEKVSYAFGDFSSCLIWQTMSVYLLYYCTNIAGIDTASAVTIISISKILDGISDIFMGFIIDRTRSRFGKVRPYLLTMSAPLAISLVLLFSVPAAFSLKAKLVWVFVCYNLVTTVFYTAMNVPYCSMHCFLTDDSQERSRLSILRLIFAYTAQVIINGTMLILVRTFGGSVDAPSGWTLSTILIGAAAFALAQVCFLGTRERVGQDTENKPKVPIKTSLRSVFFNHYLVLLLLCTLMSFLPNALVGSASAYYAQYILEDVDAVGLITNATTASQVLSLIFLAPFLLNRFPKHWIYFFGSLAAALSFFLSFLVPRQLTALLIFNAVKGVAYGITGPMLTGMIADAIDYGEWKFRVNSAGFGNAMSQCLVKFGIGIATALLGFILGLGGFDPSLAEQTAGAQRALILSYTVIPALFFTVSTIVMLFYRLDKQYPRIAAELKERRESQKKTD